jgi:hypothetical protein
MKFPVEMALVATLAGIAGLVVGRQTAEPTGPRNYSECVLDAARHGAMDGAHGNSIHMACARLFGAP